MKFLGFVDLHGSKKAYENIEKTVKNEKPEFLICAGDFTTFEHDVKSFMNRLSRLDKKIFLVHGNHEEETVVQKISKEYSNIEFVHSRIVEFKNIVVLGWGGGGFTIRDVEFENWIKRIRKEIKLFKKQGKKIIFVSHAPIYKTNVDLLYHGHHGNKSFLNFIKEFNVDISICGHFHENNGKEDKIKNCKIYNPGPEGKIITI